jgi:hypothetical protein
MVSLANIFSISSTRADNSGSPCSAVLLARNSFIISSNYAKMDSLFRKPQFVNPTPFLCSLYRSNLPCSKPLILFSNSSKFKPYFEDRIVCSQGACILDVLACLGVAIIDDYISLILFLEEIYSDLFERQS